MSDPNVQSLIDDPAIESVEMELTVRTDQEHMVHSATKRADVEPERHGSDLVELSIELAPDEAEEARHGLREFLTRQGFDVGRDQLTKTRAALELFAGRTG